MGLRLVIHFLYEDSVAILKGANNCVARMAKKALFECDCKEKAGRFKFGQANDVVDES